MNRASAATSSCSMPAAALLVAGVVDQLEEGIERAALTIDAGLATELLEALRAERRAADAAGATGMTVADSPQRRRRDRRPASRGHPGRGRRDRSGGHDRRSPGVHPAEADRRAARRAWPPPHRRDQACVAVGGPDRDRRRGHRRARPCLRSRRRLGHLGPVRAALVRRIDRRPARGAGRGRRPGPRQGLRRRGHPAADAAGRRRRHRAAAGRAP